MTKQKNTRFRMKCCAHSRAFLTAIPRHLGRFGSILLVLQLIVPPGFADQASPQETSLSASYGSQMVTLKDGRRISVAALKQMKGGKEKDDFIDNLSDEDFKKLNKYMSALLSEANTRLAEKEAALAQADAMIAAIQELSNLQSMLDLSPKAKQHRKELAAILDTALNNPLIELAEGTRRMLKASADLMREGMSPAQMDPKTLEEIKKTITQEQQAMGAGKP